MAEIERSEKRPLEADTTDSHSNKKQHLDIVSNNDIANSVSDNTLLEENQDTHKLENNGEKLFNGVEISNLSKRQLKKYKKSLKWLDVKKEKRAKERIKTKEKRLYAKLNNIDLGPSRKELKKIKMKDSPCKIGVCIDLSFDDLMIDKVG